MGSQLSKMDDDLIDDCETERTLFYLLPDDIVDDIYKRVHKMHLVECLNVIPYAYYQMRPNILQNFTREWEAKLTFGEYLFKRGIISRPYGFNYNKFKNMNTDHAKFIKFFREGYDKEIKFLVDTYIRCHTS
jgi:hypothetical protein